MEPIPPRITMARTPMDSRNVKDSGLMNTCLAENSTPMTPAKDAPRPRRQLVRADRLPGPPDVGVFEPAVHEDDQDHDEQDEEVEVLAVGQPERRGRTGDRRDALRAIREVDRLVEVVGQNADHL